VPRFFLGGGRAGSASNPMSPGPGAYRRTKWHLDPSSRLRTTDMGRKLGGAPFLKSCFPVQHNVAVIQAYLRAKFRLDLSNRLAAIHQRFKQTDRTDRRDMTTVR